MFVLVVGVVIVVVVVVDGLLCSHVPGAGTPKLCYAGSFACLKGSWRCCQAMLTTRTILLNWVSGYPCTRPEKPTGFGSPPDRMTGSTRTGAPAGYPGTE